MLRAIITYPTKPPMAGKLVRRGFFALAMLAAAPAVALAADAPAAGTEETVDQRIADLHAALQITPEEETAWNAVAQAMRDNAAAMEKLVAEKKAMPRKTRTAVQDLQIYTEFAQAHVDGLKALTTSFTALYDAMPEAQKKVADHVFRTFQPGRHHHHHHAHGRHAHKGG
jgi:periplasmic protein CpxP/Spy